MAINPIIKKRRMQSKKRKNIWQRLCSSRLFQSVIKKRRMQSEKRKNIWQCLCSPRFFRNVMRVVLVIGYICRFIKALLALLG